MPLSFTGDPTYDWLVTLGLAFAVFTVISSRFLITPYGRFLGKRAGPTLPIRQGWAVMEAPAPLVFFAVFALGPHNDRPVAWVFAAVWAIHYANRAGFFPYLMQARPDSRMAWSVILSGIVVTSAHGWLYATWVVRLGDHLTTDWLADPRFLGGLLLWAIGFAGIVHTENLLRQLRATRKEGEPAYKIPHGGGYRWVSSPHYLGEILAFTGMMICVWCPGGLVVWTLTLANLVPRALATHRWYQKEFPDYPADRKALVPFLL